MPVLRKRAFPSQQVNGLYIHFSPPRVLQLTPIYIKQLIRLGDIDKLEQVVLEGQGKKLVGEYSADYKVRTFLKSIPSRMSKISLLHDAVNSGRLEELQSLLEEEPEKKKKYVMAKDEAGTGLLHKAIYYDLKDISKYLIEKFPHIVQMKDSEGRTPYMYTPMCRDIAGIQKLLINAGADQNSTDNRQHSIKYYMEHKDELELPNLHKIITKDRRKSTNKDSLIIKKSNIRIWIHQRDLGHLQQVIWEGHGSKLLVEHSNNPRIRRFLEAIPHIMGLIKDVHCDVQNNDLEPLKARVSPPVPPIVLSGKDCNGLTPLHKAAGLGLQEIAEFIIAKYPRSVNIVDVEGRTPLHYAALLKDDGKMSDFLIENGADESALDNKQKTAAYYKTRNSEIDSKLLNVIPDCPRTAKDSFPPNWDWNLLTASTPTEEIMKIPKKTDAIFGNTTENENKSKMEQLKEVVSPTKVDSPPPGENEKTEEIIENDSVKEQSNNEVEKEVEETKETEEIEETENIENNDDENNKKSEEVQDDNIEEANGEENVNDEDNVNEEEEEEQNTSRPSSIQRESRPSSTLNANSRSGTPIDSNSRPASDMNENQHKSKTRPNSKMVEYENNLRPASYMEETGSRTRPSSKFDAHENNEAEVVEPEAVIEGVVNGENEIETLNEEGQDKSEDGKNDDPEIISLIETGNMEQLAALVLNGEGERLVGQQSDNGELQSFLDNVPVYMSKINRIHVAARDGSLRDLQAALDRRKFAIAKDNISPYGGTPLHVATIFGNTSIVRYLAGRFPETVQSTDNNGRTPLHYAAVVADNGHYYNLLVHLGANTRTEDNLGHTPEYYRVNQNEFSHRHLLEEFGADDEILEEMLSDKVPDDTFSARKDLDDEDMIAVLERCYNVLHGRRNSNTISATSTMTMSSSGSQSQNTNLSLLAKHMKRYMFDAVKLRLTKLDHNLYDVIWPNVKRLPTEQSFRVALEQDFPAGIVAPDAYSYKVFNELLIPLIKDINCIDLHLDLHDHPETKFVNIAEKKEDEEETGEELRQIDISLDLDPHAKWIISENARGDHGVDMPFFRTEEGRYLASSLGDPLIKGLTEVANKRPEDPIAYLATYLYNFANSKTRGKTQENQQVVTVPVEESENNNAVPASIDVVTLEPDEGTPEDDSAFSNTSRDEHGQSMLHFAAARSHGRNALFQLLMETEINVGYRDELYRTARDISIQANIPENTMEIDRYVIQIATKGDTDKLVELLLDGYDHIIDIVDEDDVPVIEAVSKHNQTDTVAFLQSILAFEEKRERVHHAIRQGSVNDVTKLLADENDTGSGKLLAIGKNSYGRCTLHIAVLCQQEEIVDYLANTFPDTLRVGDNLERTALHYAMGVEKIETISRVLIKAGAKRVLKDLKGRQPTYYFMNKSDILRLQEEEETF